MESPHPTRPADSILPLSKTFAEKLLLRNFRLLTAGEREFLKTIFHDTIDYDRVKIQKGLFLKINTGAMVVDNSISFKENLYAADFTQNPRQNLLALLAHEACHVWQFQNLRYCWPLAVLEHIRYRGRVYDYQPRENTILTDYRYEQQGRIVQDYVGGKHPQRALLEEIIEGAMERMSVEFS